jgi:hypothetical protein
MHLVVFTAGVLVVGITCMQVLFTLVLPRKPSGLERLTLAVNAFVRLCFVGLARLARTYERQDSLLASAGPVALVAQLLTWAALLTSGFGLVLVAGGRSFADGFLQAVTSLLTLGTVHPGGHPQLAVDIFAGAIWAVVVALQIAYLPALYSAVSSREALVALLESRAGLPAWGPELLARHQLVGIVDTLPELYASWEEWAAAVAESHTTYPVLLLFRSPEPWYSWVIGLLAVLDGAAMHLALAPSSASSQARLCLRMGFTMLRRVAAAIGWEIEDDPSPEGPIQLSFNEYAQAVEMLASVGFPIEKGAKESWPDFRGWRVNYEEVAYRLAEWLTAPPAPWSGPRRHLRVHTVVPRRPPQRAPGEIARPSAERATHPIGTPPRRSRARRGGGSKTA